MKAICFPRREKGAVVSTPVAAALCRLALIQAAKGFSNYLPKITWRQEKFIAFHQAICILHSEPLLESIQNQRQIRLRN